MRSASYCYLPILRARDGAFQAVSTLSPKARSRLTPIFDVPAPVLKEGKTLDDYLNKRVDGIHKCWERERPVYIDVHDINPDLRTSDGRQPITYLIDTLRQYGSIAIPVTGALAERGKDYVDAVRQLVASHQHGVCFRLSRDELEEAALLRQSLDELLDSLKYDPSQIDVALDFRYVGRDNVERLRATALEALATISAVGAFRNVAFAGSSIPEQLGKADQGKIRREKRVELDAWSQIITGIANARQRVPVALSDYGVVGAYYVPPAKFVQAPSRIRYTTLTEHVFLRAKRNEYRKICEQLVASDAYQKDSTFSTGDRNLSRAAQGLQKGSGAPAIWVANDTNRHLELVSAQSWELLKKADLSSRFALPEPYRQPWLQPELQ